MKELKMKFDKNAVFYDCDGIPVVIGAGNGLPSCCALDEKHPRKFPIDSAVKGTSINYEGFMDLVNSFHTES
jgi:hypothetical protein